MKTTFVLSVTETSQVGEARRNANTLSSRLGSSETDRGKLSIVVTELANNLVKHTRSKGGELIIRALEDTNSKSICVEVLSLDRGPGMLNVTECLRDGFSTAGSPGTGLGAVKRLSHLFEVQSSPDMGTAILSRMWFGNLPLNSEREQFEVGVVCLPIAGEEACGDGWAVHQNLTQNLFLVADGLGHGLLACEASTEAVRIFHENQENHSPTEIIQLAHGALRKTRGAAMAVTHLDLAKNIVRFVGVGNIAGTVVPPQIHGQNHARSMVSHNGTVGVEIRKIQEFSYPWVKGSLLVLNSDGLVTHWKLDQYPGLKNKHPSLIAGILYRDFKRGSDDVTILVARERDR